MGRDDWQECIQEKIVDHREPSAEVGGEEEKKYIPEGRGGQSCGGREEAHILVGEAGG